VTDYIGKTVHQ